MTTTPDTGGRFRLKGDGTRERVETPTRQLSRAEARAQERAPRARRAATRGPADREVDAAVVEAIEGLRPDDPDAWTAGGKPKTEALAERLGRTVTANERDRAWSVLRNEPPAAGNEE